MKFDLTVRNVAGRDGQRAPKVDAEEVEIVPVDKIGDVVTKLRGRAIYPKAMLALFGGLRRGEIAALRWPRVKFDAKLVEVRELIEETKEHGPRAKATKTRAGTRSDLPCIAAHARLDADRLQHRRREDRQAARSRQPDDHAAGLRPPLPEARRRLGRGRLMRPLAPST